MTWQIWIRDAADGSWSIAGALMDATRRPTAVVMDDDLILVSNGDGADVWLYNFVLNATLVLPFPYGFATWPPGATNVAELGTGRAVVASAATSSSWVYTMVNPPLPPHKHHGPWAQQHAFAVVVGVFIILASVVAVGAFFMPDSKKKKKQQKKKGKQSGDGGEDEPLIVGFE